MSKRREFVVVFLAGALFFYGVSFVVKEFSVQNGSLVPSARAQTGRPISTEELETVSSPVTIPRPLEVPEVYAFERSLDPTTTQVIIVDSKRSRICVYHIGQDGSIEFVANRNYTWDMTLDVFNEKGLTPSQIREYYETNRIGK
jgi:hypothetical protein